MEANGQPDRECLDKGGSLILALALASGKSLRDAAAAAGVSEQTARRRFAKPAFRRRVIRLRSDMVRQALGRLTDSMCEAADTLRTLLRAKNESIRLNAARSILEVGQRLRESIELEERLRQIEELLDKERRGGNGERRQEHREARGPA